MSLPLTQLLTVRDVAKRWKVHRHTARRWLLALEAQRGPGLVTRLRDCPRSKLAITSAALVYLEPPKVQEGAPGQIEEEKRAFADQDRLQALEAQLQAVTCQVRRLEGQLHKLCGFAPSWPLER